MFMKPKYFLGLLCLAGAAATARPAFCQTTEERAGARSAIGDGDGPLDVGSEVGAASFRTNGCGYMIAAAAVLADTVDGRELSALHGLEGDALFQTIEAELGPLPAGRRQCAEVCIDALHTAFRSHRSRLIEEFRGEKALICTCFGVTEETIEQFIAEHRPQSVEEVTEACRAGGGCGSCQMLIQEMLDGSAAYDSTAEQL